MLTMEMLTKLDVANLIQDSAMETKLEATTLEVLKKKLNDVVYTIHSVSQLDPEASVITVKESKASYRYELKNYVVSDEFKIFITPRDVRFDVSYVWASLLSEGKNILNNSDASVHLLNPDDFRVYQTQILAAFGKEARFTGNLDDMTKCKSLSSQKDLYVRGGRIYSSTEEVTGIPVILKDELFSKDYMSSSMSFSVFKTRFGELFRRKFISKPGMTSILSKGNGKKPSNNGKGKSKPAAKVEKPTEENN